MNRLSVDPSLVMVENWTAYTCRKGCQATFFSEDGRRSHENFLCSFVGFDNPSSPEMTSLTSVFPYTLNEPLDPSMSPNGNFLEPRDGFDLNNMPFEDFNNVGVVVEVETDDLLYMPNVNMQPQLTEMKRVQDIMGNRRNKAGERDLSVMFSYESPKIVDDRYAMELEKKSTDTVIPEWDSEDSLGVPSDIDEIIKSSGLEVNFDQSDFQLIFESPILNLDCSLPVQQPTASCSQETTKESFDSEENIILSPSDGNTIDLKESTFIPTGADSQPPINLLTFLDENSKEIPAFVPIAAPVPIPIIEQPPRKRGRPKKDQSKTTATVQNIEISRFHPYMSDTVLPDRRCKTASLQRIRSSISEGSESGSSDIEYSSTCSEVSRKKTKKAPSRSDQDPDYEDMNERLDTLSVTSREDCTEDLNDEQLERRRKNNLASKLSRQKHKARTLEVESVREKLEERVKYLTLLANKLEEAWKIGMGIKCSTL